MHFPLDAFTLHFVVSEGASEGRHHPEFGESIFRIPFEPLQSLPVDQRIFGIESTYPKYQEIQVFFDGHPGPQSKLDGATKNTARSNIHIGRNSA